MLWLEWGNREKKVGKFFPTHNYLLIKTHQRKRLKQLKYGPISLIKSLLCCILYRSDRIRWMESLLLSLKSLLVLKKRLNQLCQRLTLHASRLTLDVSMSEMMTSSIEPNCGTLSIKPAPNQMIHFCGIQIQII